MDRAQKAETVEVLHEAFSSTKLVVVAKHDGLTVAEVTDLRRRMRAAGAGFRVTKNRLARIALKGTEFEALDGMFSGPTAVAYAEDPVGVSKVATAYAQENEKFTVLGAGFAARVLDAEGVKALATMPSLDVLRAKILGMIVTPATRIASVLQAPGGQVARVLRAYADKEAA